VLLYRVFPHLSTAPSGQPGHPLYIHPNQGYGRFDNPAHYLAWYMASEAASAIGETFADIAVWQDAMFDFPSLPGSRKALGIYDLRDDLPYVAGIGSTAPPVGDGPLAPSNVASTPALHPGVCRWSSRHRSQPATLGPSARTSGRSMRDRRISSDRT
jgi:hypothetical protein